MEKKCLHWYGDRHLGRMLGSTADNNWGGFFSGSISWSEVITVFWLLFNGTFSLINTRTKMKPDPSSYCHCSKICKYFLHLLMFLFFMKTTDFNNTSGLIHCMEPESNQHLMERLIRTVLIE